MRVDYESYFISIPFVRSVKISAGTNIPHDYTFRLPLTWDFPVSLAKTMKGAYPFCHVYISTTKINRPKMCNYLKLEPVKAL